MQSLPRSCLLTAVVLSALLVLDAPIEAEDSVSDISESQEEVIQRILELRAQIEDLLEILPDEVRLEVERRWRENQVATPVETTDPEPEVEEIASSEPDLPTPPAIEPEDPLASETDTAEELTVEKSEEIAPPCGGFHLFDSNQDSFVSAGDRQWRHLRLWIDTNGNDIQDEDEIKSLFELGVRQIEVGLRSYIDTDGDSEDVEVNTVIWLHRVGKGNTKRPSGVLVVEADRLIRDGRLWLTDPDGVQLIGYQPLRSGVFLDTREGERFPVLCQEPD